MARVEPSLEPMRECLLASESARAYVPETTILLFGRTLDDRIAVYVFGDGSPWMPAACMARALDMPQLEKRRMLETAFVSVEIVIEVPGS